MSRSNYSDDFGDDFPGQAGLYRANVDRSMRSRTGQQRLTELREALLALPTKELQHDIFAAGTNEAPRVCALGAWALAKCGGDVKKARELVGHADDDRETADALSDHGWPHLVVLEAVYENDDADLGRVREWAEGPSESPYAYYGNHYRGLTWTREETPAERYRRVLAWVEARIVAPSAAGRAR